MDPGSVTSLLHGKILYLKIKPLCLPGRTRESNLIHFVGGTYNRFNEAMKHTNETVTDWQNILVTVLRFIQSMTAMKYEGET